MMVIKQLLYLLLLSFIFLYFGAYCADWRPNQAVRTDGARRVDIINITGPINYSTTTYIILYADQALKLGTSEIRLHISSPGGDLNEAISAFSFLRHLPIPVNTVNCGSVESAAIILYLAGDERTFLPGAGFTLHAVGAPLNGTFTLNQLNTFRQQVTVDIERFREITVDRTQGKIVGDEATIDIDSVLSGDTFRINGHTAFINGIATSEGILTSKEPSWTETWIIAPTP